MKKVFAIILIVLCGFTLVGGGIFLLSNYYYEQNEVEESIEDENSSDNGEEDEGDDSVYPDAQSSFTIYVKGLYYTSSTTSYETTSSNYQNSTIKFNVYWYDENGNGGQGWGSNGYDMTTYKAYNTTVSVTDGNVTNLSYFYYHWEPFWGIGVYKRYMGIDPFNNSGGSAACFGVSLTNSSTSNSNYRTPSIAIYYLSNGTLHTSSSTAKSSASSIWSATAYVIYREKYSVTFNTNGGSGGPSDMTVYAGIGYTMPSTKPTRTGYTFAGWKRNNSGTAYSAGYNFADSWVSSDDAWYASWTPNVYTISLDKQSGSGGTSTLYLKYNTGWYSNSGATTSISTITKPTRTGYTFQGYYTGTGGSGTQIINSSGSILSGKLTYIAASDILYAKWLINTYKLTINYYGGSTRQSTQSKISITPSWGGTQYTLASDQSVSLSLTYNATTDYLLTINTQFMGYYIETNSEPTINSTKNTKNITWKPIANTTISIYVKQGYTITYNSNLGTGSTPSSLAKIHGTAVTLATNSLSKTSYSANGWNTNKAGTGTHYASGASYSANASTTLYADWAAKNSTINVQLKTSTNGTTYSNSATGGTVSVKYYYDSNNLPTLSSATSVTTASVKNIASNALINQTVTFTPTANSGYVFVGVTTNSVAAPNSATATAFTPTSSGATYTIYVYFKVLSKNQLKYDSTEKYWYFEEGVYPQSYVGTSLNNTLNGGGAKASSMIEYCDGTSTNGMTIYEYNGKEYARLQAETTQTLKMSDGVTYTFTRGQYYWFEVEPIRWRISDYGVSSTDYPTGWETYGTYKKAFTVVSDRAITISAVTNIDVKESWSFLDSEMNYYINTLNENSSEYFSANIANRINAEHIYNRFGNAGQQNKVIEFREKRDGVEVVSQDELDDYLTDYSAKASDLVCFLLGCGTDDKVEYWTRDLGVNLGNGQVVTTSGTRTSCWLRNVRAVRLSLTMSEGSRI